MIAWKTVLVGRKSEDQIRIVESLEVEGIFKGQLVQIPCNEHRHAQLDQSAQSPPGLTSKAFRVKAPTTSWCNLF